MPRLFLIDAMSLVFRAYHAMSRSGLSTPDGEPTGAVFGFANIISTIIDNEKPDYLSVVFDTAAPTFRHEQYEEYKANRPEFPEDLVPQVKRIKEMIDLLGYCRVERDGYEADDIIGTMTKWAVEHDLDVFCVTSDKDYMQLVSDRVKLFRPTGKGAGDYEVVDIEGVAKKFGVAPERVIDVQALIGDSVDNVPGVKGIGEKTAIPLIQEFGSLENLYENLDKVQRAAVLKKLEADRDNAFMSKELVTIDVNVPIEVDINGCRLRDKDVDGLKQLFTTLNFRRMIPQRFGIDMDGDGEADENGATAGQVGPDTLDGVDHNYLLLDSLAKIRAAIKQLADVKMLAFDTETTGLDPMSCDLVGVSFAAKAGEAYYIPLFRPREDIAGFDELNIPATEEETNSGTLFAEDSKPVHQYNECRAVLEMLKPLLEDPAVGKVGQNIKYDLLVLKRYGIDAAPVAFDTMLASYVLNADNKHGMDELSRVWLNYQPISITTLIGEKKSTQKSMSEVPVADVAKYAAEDADITWRLYEKLQDKLREDKLEELARSTEFELVLPLTQMEFNGVGIDPEALKQFSVELGEMIEAKKAEIYEEAGSEFNIDSPKQLSEILFDKMGIPPVKKTKTGFSTDSSVLEELAHSFPIATMVQDYRQMTKLRSTYVDALPKMINAATGRIHTTYNQTVASTGRLSSTDPNLQNIPIRTELGRRIRQAFIPAEGSKILSADYSQIELRIMAHICGDETLTHAFQNGLDIHAATAANLFGVALEDVDSEMRRRAKTVNFGLMYGLGAFGLAQRLGISRTEGKEIIDAYFAKYPRIKEYIDSSIAAAGEKGYGETLLGRRRYFPNIKASNRALRSAAERAAINMPIQGSAADMLKLATVTIYREMKERNMKSLMMLQVHDELVFEVPQQEIDELNELVKTRMESAMPLGEVPVEVNIGIGDNWDEAH